MPEAKTTPARSGFSMDPSTMNMLTWLLGGGASAVMGEHQNTWQAMMGQMGQQAASSQQYGELLKKLLAGGGSVSADGKGTTLKMPSGEPTTQFGGTLEGGGGGGGQQQSQSNIGLLHLLLSGGI